MKQGGSKEWSRRISYVAVIWNIPRILKSQIMPWLIAKCIDLCGFNEGEGDKQEKMKSFEGMKRGNHDERRENHHGGKLKTRTV